MGDTVGAPRRQSFSDIAISTIAGVDTVGGIQSILMTHDRGYLNTSAMLWDAMKRDDRISGVIKTRVGALIAAPLEIEAASSKAKAARVAKLLSGDGEDEHGLWEQMCPPSTIKKLSEWGNALGIGLAEIIWNTAADTSSWTQIAPGMDVKAPGKVGWVPRLRLWHPQFVYWDWGQNRFMVMAQEGVVPLPRIDENPYSDGKWVVWCPYGYQYGWLDGLVRSLADKYLMRGWDYRDWARYNERHGMATIGAQVPADADKDVKEQFTQDLAGIGSDAVVQLPQLDGENKFDMKMIEAKSRSFDSFQLFKKELDVDIAVAVLGQNLTTEGGTDGGSRALGQVQNLVRIDKAIEDAAIATCLRQQVLTWWCQYNFGDPELAPRPEYQVEPPEDELKEATALKMMGDALGSMKTASAPIDVRTILDRAGVPMITEEEEAAAAAVAAEERAAALEAQQQNGSDNGQSTNGAPGGKSTPPGAPGGGAGAALTTSMRIPIPGPVKRYTFAGLPIAVENEAGSIRTWRDPGPDGGVIGTTTMLNDYGYVEGHLGSDDEELDCYIGPNEAAPHVHVVHQLAAPDFKSHDEDKVMLGWDDPGAAKAAYLAHRSDEKAFGGMSVIPLAQFHRKLKARTSTGKIRATAIDVRVARQRETVAALVRLADRDRAGVALKAGGRTTAGKRRAASYADGVADNAKRIAARALAVDLAAIKEEIDAATSFDDLRRRILVRYKGMDPKRLAGVVEKARIMANLGGQESALKEV